MIAKTAEKPVKTDDDWQREATHAAAVSARQIATGENINGRAMVSSLSEIEWGWIVCAAIFAWIRTKAEQAVAEGKDYDMTIRAMSNRDPEPWEAGAITSILPDLGSIDGLDWDQPIGEWSKDQIVKFAWSIHRMSNSAMASRDEGAVDKIVRFAREPAERQHSAAHGGPLMSHDEMSQEIPF